MAITQPANNSQVNRNSTVTITATASDNRVVQKVEIFVNNSLRCTDTAAPYTCNWAVPSQSNVTYTIRARAYDGANNTTDATVRVTAR